jgi:hypothetical protein
MLASAKWKSCDPIHTVPAAKSAPSQITQFLIVRYPQQYDIFPCTNYIVLSSFDCKNNNKRVNYFSTLAHPCILPFCPDNRPLGTLSEPMIVLQSKISAQNSTSPTYRLKLVQAWRSLIHQHVCTICTSQLPAYLACNTSPTFASPQHLSRSS